MRTPAAAWSTPSVSNLAKSNLTDFGFLHTLLQRYLRCRLGALAEAYHEDFGGGFDVDNVARRRCKFARFIGMTPDVI